VCPVEKVTYVKVGTQFPGCPAGPTSTGGCSCHSAEEIVATINSTHLEAVVVNGVEEVLGAAIVTVNGKSFTLNITSTIPLSELVEKLKEHIAHFLGGSYTADEIVIEIVGKKRATSGSVLVTLHEPTISGATTFFISPICFTLFVAFLATLI